MDPAARSLLGRWLYASKPASWPKLLVPALFGQALGVAACGALGTAAMGWGALFTVLNLLFIVFMNDWGDRDVDAVKRAMFPERCSPKTIPDGILPARALLAAGLLAAVGALGVATYAGLQLDRPLLPFAALACAVVFWSYTLPPIKLNYRGGGEALETLGVGLLLPWTMFYVQSGRVFAPELLLLVALLPLCMASALASGLADERSDRKGGKRTFATEHGNKASRDLIERLVLLSALLWAVGLHFVHVVPLPIGALCVAIVLLNYRRMRLASRAALTDAFAALGRYKRALHHAVWRTLGWLAVAILAASWWSAR